MTLGLERSDRVARRMLPEAFFAADRSVRVITVAGTNGKGSTVATLAAILKQSGIRTGAWTSPHLHSFNERIRIDGEMVGDQAICTSFECIESLRGEDFISYYEFGFLAALDIFVQRQVEVILLEVGLGGRLDAVNIVDADVSIVTTVDLDHTAWLGDTVDEIAREKAGIFRSGRPAICGEVQPATSLINYIQEIKALELRNGQAFQFDVVDAAGEGSLSFEGRLPNGITRTFKRLPKPSLPLTSVVCALQSLLWLWPDMPEDTIHNGLQNAALEGRCQRIMATNLKGEPVTVMLDVAHNPQAARYLAEVVKEELAGSPIAVLGMLNDKDLNGVLVPLKGCFSCWNVASVGYQERARSSEELQQGLEALGEQAGCYGSVAEALTSALDNADGGSAVVVLGSFHTVGESLAELERRDSHQN